MASGAKNCFIVIKSEWLRGKITLLISKVNVKSVEFSLSIIVNRTRAAMNVNLLGKELIFLHCFFSFASALEAIVVILSLATANQPAPPSFVVE